MVVKTFGNKHGKEMKMFEYEFTIKPRFGEAIKINAIAVPTICAPIGGQVIKEAIKSHPFLQKIYLADDGTHPDTPIGLLLGADMYWKMVMFWDLDTIGIKENESSVYDTFMESITFDKGRYHVELPFKENHALLSDNYNLSLKRLKKLKSRLSNDVELLKHYDNVFKEQLKLGIIEEVEEPGEVGHVTYLPHREVIREDKTSTKLRVVVDASAKSRENVSLNDVLYKGPCLTPLLYDVLLRFRIHPVAIIADIEKAYLQIGIKENHRDFLRCLWYRNVFADVPEIVKLRFCRVIFGAAPSQFLLNGSVKKHVNKYEKIDPLFTEKVRKSFYVDDLCSGTKDVSTGYTFYKKTKLRFAEAQFNVRKWNTNCKELQDLINKAENKIDASSNYEKVLGITWNVNKDTLLIGVSEIF